MWGIVTMSNESVVGKAEGGFDSEQLCLLLGCPYCSTIDLPQICPPNLLFPHFKGGYLGERLEDNAFSHLDLASLEHYLENESDSNPRQELSSARYFLLL